MTNWMAAIRLGPGGPWSFRMIAYVAVVGTLASFVAAVPATAQDAVQAAREAARRMQRLH